MTAFLDTQVCVWTAQGDVQRLSKPAYEAMQSAELLISPGVLIELGYLFAIESILVPPRENARNVLPGFFGREDSKTLRKTIW